VDTHAKIWSANLKRCCFIVGQRGDILLVSVGFEVNLFRLDELP